MFVLPLLAIAIVVLVACGGRIGRLAEVRLTHPWLAIVGVIGTNVAYKSGLYYGTPTIGRPMWMLSIGAVGLCMYLNRRHRGLLLAAGGAVLNVVVIAANGGRMPTGHWGFRMLERMPAWYREPGIVGGDPSIPLPWTSAHTHLNFLADVLPPIFPLAYPPSVGDVLLASGAIWFLASVLLGHVERRGMIEDTTAGVVETVEVPDELAERRAIRAATSAQAIGFADFTWSFASLGDDEVDVQADLDVA